MTRSCPGCGSDRPRHLAAIAASAVVRENDTYRPEALDLLGVAATASYDIVQCVACDFAYAHELPDETLLATLYGKVIDPAVREGSATEEQWKAHQLALAAELVRRAASAGNVRMLDYGCGDGTVVRALNAAGISCAGFEPHPRRPPDGTIADSVKDLEGRFTAVLLSDVLEHVAEPKEVLATCHALLSDGGWLCVSVPDFNPRRMAGILSDLRGGRPVTREVNPWEHLNYFSPATLVSMVRGSGFVVDAEPVRDFGFRGSARGLRRVTNTIRSAGRLLGHAMTRAPGSTTIFARKTRR